MFNLEKQKENFAYESEFATEEMIDRIIEKLELVVEKMKVVGHSNGYWTIEEHEQIIGWLKELKIYRLAIKQCKKSSYMVNSKEFAKNMEEWAKEQLRQVE